MSLTRISVFPNRDKVEGDNKPDLRLVASWKEGEEFKNVTVGALWKKQDKNGGTFYSGEMRDGYTNSEGQQFPGFTITRDDAPVQAPTDFDNDTVENQVADAGDAFAAN